MHELGVVFHVLDIVRDLAKKNNVNHVYSVTVQIGEVSGVIPYYFEDVWKWACAKEDAGVVKGCLVRMEKQEAVTICEDCDKTYPTVKFGKICPYCKSEHTHLVIGSGVAIKNIEVVD